MFGRDAALALVLLVVSCDWADSSAGADGHARRVRSSLGAVVDSASDSVDVGRNARWPALVRDERWDAAWRGLDALTEPERSRPEIRYARARVALARDDAASALPLLVGLENELPLLADDVARRRAEAKLSVGPFVDAGEWFAARGTPSGLLDAARAFEKAKDPIRARAAVDRVLGNSKRTRVEEARARALRARLAGDDVTARADVRWLATEGADVRVDMDPLTELARLDPDHPLTVRELVARAQLLSDAGRLDDALQALDMTKSAPRSHEVSVLDRSRLRGMALYRAGGHASEAARVLAECAQAGGSHAAEDAFHAARALSRADRDEEAIVAYEKVNARYPGTVWGAKAAFYGPYLRMLHGDWTVCARGFARAIGAKTPAEQADDARRDGALCALMSGDIKAARRAFEHLADDEHDAVSHARMANMAALAAVRDDDRTHAVARWTDVARTYPLTWPAMIARARLAEVGAPVPPEIDDDAATGADPVPLVVRLPPPADLLHAIGLDGDAEAALREREGVLSAGESRASEFLCRAYGELGRARRRYQISQALSPSLFAAKPGHRTRWAWECAFPAPYEDDVRAAETREHLPVGLLWAVMRQESGFDPEAVSPARAVGIMQLMPEVARPIADELDLPSDEAKLKSPSVAIPIAARLLGRLVSRFQGQIPLGVAAYNAGADAVVRWLSHAPGLDLDTFVERIPYGETRQYVVRVMGNFARYGYLGGGEAQVPRVALGIDALRRF